MAILVPLTTFHLKKKKTMRAKKKNLYKFSSIHHCCLCRELMQLCTFIGDYCKIYHQNTEQKLMRRPKRKICIYCLLTFYYMLEIFLNQQFLGKSIEY
jgi:hypothetical protein